jgi:hypothetical protein
VQNAGKKASLMVDEMYQALDVRFPYYRLKEPCLEIDFLAAGAKKGYHSKGE